jgi:hypothetical protein
VCRELTPKLIAKPFSRKKEITTKKEWKINQRLATLTFDEEKNTQETKFEIVSFLAYSGLLITRFSQRHMV